MPIDPSIALAGRAPQIENPLNYLLQAQQVQQTQNQNSLFPMMQQEQALKLIQAQRMNQLIGNVLSRRAQAQGDQPQGNALSAPSGMPGMPQQGNALSAPQGQGMPQAGTGSNDYEDLVMAGYAPAEKAWSIHKEGQQGSTFKPGETYVVNGRTFTVPLLAPGMQMGADGQVVPIPGFAGANSAIEGAKATATERAKNAQTPVSLDRIDPRTMKPYTGSVDTMLNPPVTPAGPKFSGTSLLDRLPPEQAAAIRAELAKSGGKASLNINLPDGTHLQGPLDMTQAEGAYTPPAVGSDGKPVPLQLQQTLGTLAASRDPAKLTAFRQQMLDQISHLPDSPEKQAAVQRLDGEVQKIAQSWQLDSAPGGQQPGAFSFASPTDIALDKQRREAALKQDADPRLAYANKASEALQKKAEYVGSQLSESQGLLQRIEQSREALTKFKAGGGMGTGVELAQYAQALHMPDGLVNRLAGGNLAAAQEFQKFAAQEALGTMQQALANDSGAGSKGNKMAMELFIKNNPNITTDPNAIEKIFNFQTKLHNELLNKSDMLAKFVSDPTTTKDPLVFDNLYARSQIKSGNVTPQFVQGQAKGTTPVTPANVQAILEKYK